jgi:diguanylate cyclase (GGDEF)-like protein
MTAWVHEIGLGAGSAVSLAALLVVVLLVVVLVSHVRGRRRAQETAALAASLQQAHDELQRVAFLDALTGLPNRVHFEQRLRQSTAQPRAGERRFAVLFIDLDDFASVNDSLGHAVGDEVLREAGRRLQALAGGGVDAARIGGDSFVLRVDGGRDAAAALARRVVAAMQQPFVVDGREAHLTCSVGIAVYPEHGEGARLITHADAAMAAAKRSGGAGHAFFAPAPRDPGAVERLGLLADLRHAVARGELTLLYQPKIDARSGQVMAAEALLRWDHPTRGLVPPAVFVPVAERYGLIGTLGAWVIDDACRQARAWRDAGLRMRVAVNLSALQLRDETLVDRLLEALQRHGVRPNQLTCEITETVAMSDTAAARRTFERLGAAGIHVSIDDFGTGYSSLAYLRQLPVEELKIDRGFVADLAHSDDARAIVEAVLQMAHALGLRVVAEGVEDAVQRDLLVQMGCDELQGYFFAHPMPAEALTRWALGGTAAQAAHAPLEFRPSLFAPSVHAGL